MRKKVFLDAMLTGPFQELISIGLVSDCGRTFYGENADYDAWDMEDEVRDHVLPRLLFPMNVFCYTPNTPPEFAKHYPMKGGSELIAAHLTGWCYSLGEIEIWCRSDLRVWSALQNMYGDFFPKQIHQSPFMMDNLFEGKDMYPVMDMQVDQYKKKIYHSLHSVLLTKTCYEQLMKR